MSIVMSILDILGTVAFSLSGAIEAMKKRMDMLGVLVLGLITAVGGGIIRDIIIGRFPPTVFRSPNNALVAIITALTTFLVAAIFNKKSIWKAGVLNWILYISDAIGLGAFTVHGIRFVEHNTGYTSFALLLFVGVITGVGGGILRDIFAGNMPFIFRKHVYATASIAGALCYLLLCKIAGTEISTVVSVLLVVVIRILATKYEWNLPRVNLEDNKDNQEVI